MIDSDVSPALQISDQIAPVHFEFLLDRSDAVERSDYAGDGPHRPATLSTMACSAVPRVDGERGDAAGDSVGVGSSNAL